MTRMKQSTLMAIAATALLLVSAMSAPPARAFDLTGTWRGTVACKTYAGATGQLKIIGPLLVLQTGHSVTMSLSTVGRDYIGRTIEAAGTSSNGDAGTSGNGEVFLIACGTDTSLSGFDELVRAQVTVRASGKATFTATSLFNDGELPVVGTCKWVFTRKDTAPPSITSCP